MVAKNRGHVLRQFRASCLLMMVYLFLMVPHVFLHHHGSVSEGSNLGSLRAELLDKQVQEQLAWHEGDCSLCHSVAFDYPGKSDPVYAWPLDVRKTVFLYDAPVIGTGNKQRSGGLSPPSLPAFVVIA